MFSPPVTGNDDLDAFLYDIYIGNAGSNAVATGGIGYSPSGTLLQYSKQYIHVKYADDNVGTGLINVPTNKQYFGLYNSDIPVESTNPADYTWYLVDGGFGTLKRFWYKTIGGAYIDYVVSDRSPDNLFAMDLGDAINLNIAVSFNGSIGRLAYAKAETPQLAATPYNLTTFGGSSFPAAGTWGFGETWQSTPPTVTGSEILFQVDGLYSPASNTTTWSSPYLATLKVGALSALTANLGTVTAGSILGGNININNKFIVGPDGTTAISSGSSGARVIITNDSIKVYDGVLPTPRVIIGSLV